MVYEIEAADVREKDEKMEMWALLPFNPRY